MTEPSARQLALSLAHARIRLRNSRRSRRNDTAEPMYIPGAAIAKPLRPYTKPHRVIVVVKPTAAWVVQDARPTCVAVLTGRYARNRCARS